MIKHIVSILILSFMCMQLRAQSFVEHHVDWETVVVPGDINLGDFDGDGFTDWLYGYSSYLGGFTAQLNIPGGYTEGPSVAGYFKCSANEAFDIQGDERAEAIGFENEDDELWWFGYDTLDEDFDDGHLILDNIEDYPVRIKCMDFDTNGTNDILIDTYDFILFFSNDGDGNFDLDTLAIPETDQFYTIRYADFEHDGDWDIFCKTSEDDLKVYKNDGGDFSVFYIDTVDNWTRFEVGDIDLDHDIDMIGTYADTTYLIKNSGDTSFTRIAIGDLLWTVIIADMNQDNLPDILGDDDNVVTQFRQLPGGDFVTDTLYETWEYYDGCCGALNYGDKDNDGDPDLYVFYEPYKSWLENDQVDSFVCATPYISSVIMEDTAISYYWSFAVTDSFILHVECTDCAIPYTQDYTVYENHLYTDMPDSCGTYAVAVTYTCDGTDFTSDPWYFDLICYPYYRDADGDGYGNPDSMINSPGISPVGYVLNAADCDDANNLISPDAAEICNGMDENCNGIPDDGIPSTTFYFDGDGDGFGDVFTDSTTCYPEVPGYTTDSADCNDSDFLINPLASEICNALDDNCNGDVDEGFTFNTFYMDADSDTYGNAMIDTSTCLDEIPGYITDNTDCDDTDPAIYPGATESLNGLDDNCDGDIDEGLVNIHSQINSAFQLIIYPVPASDKINLILPAEIKLPLTLSIYNIHGEMINQIIATDYNFSIDISNFSAGVFLIKCNDVQTLCPAIIMKN